MHNLFTNSRILVTGSCGTVGRELVRQLLEDYSVGELTGLDNNESELFFQDQQFSKRYNARFFLADIRDREKLGRAMRGIDIIFHTAAFKHVLLCERSPYEAVQTNILGVQNVITEACENHVKTVMFTSSDKAVNPTNVMGTSKLMGEKLVTAANNFRDSGTVLSSTRFGNVLGSRGSVIPIFREQIKKGGPVTLTDYEMSRFIMSIRDAVHLVIESSFLAKGGEVFITKMPVIKIADLAEVMIRELAPLYQFDPEQIDIDIIGRKPGEKLYEELMNDEEMRRSMELPDYYVVIPAFKSFYHEIKYEYPDVITSKVNEIYNSRNLIPLSQQELLEFLKNNRLLDEPAPFHPDERYWPFG